VQLAAPESAVRDCSVFSEKSSLKSTAHIQLPAHGLQFASEAVTRGQSALRCDAHRFASKNAGHWSSAHGFEEVHGRRKKLMSHSEASKVDGDFAPPCSVQSGNWMAKHPLVLKHSV
jgi:hypothetical protein